MNENQLAESQRLKANAARQEGTIRDIIVQVLREQKGIAHRKHFLSYIPEKIDLTEDEVNAMHEVSTESGDTTQRNYFISCIDWVLSDMRDADIIDLTGKGYRRLLDMDITNEEVIKKLENSKNIKRKPRKKKISKSEAKLSLTNFYYNRDFYKNSFSTPEQIKIGTDKESIFRRIISGENIEDILESYRK